MSRDQYTEKLIRLAIKNLNSVANQTEKAAILEIASEILPEGELKEKCSTTSKAIYSAERKQLELCNLLDS